MDFGKLLSAGANLAVKQGLPELQKQMEHHQAAQAAKREGSVRTLPSGASHSRSDPA